MNKQTKRLSIPPPAPRAATDTGLFATITFLRWAGLAGGMALALSSPGLGRLQLAGIAVLALQVAGRTALAFTPWGHQRRLRHNTLLDLVPIWLGFALLGPFAGGFIALAVPSAVLVGLAHGYRVSLVANLVTVCLLWTARLLPGTEASIDPATLTIGSVLVVLVGALGAFMHTLRQSYKTGLLEDELSRMTEANALLLALHNVAQTLPSALEMQDILTSSRNRMNDVFDFDFATILTRDTLSGQWSPGLQQGTRVDVRAEADLPEALRQTVQRGAPVLVDNFGKWSWPPIASVARSGMYTPLVSRGELVGAIGLENSAPGRFSEQDAKLFYELCEPLAVAIDNALWFGRLKALGAQAERIRIARDIHDRLAQSLAYISFELERLDTAGAGDSAGHAAGDSEGRSELGELRSVVRDLIGDVRETLYSLRTGVTIEITFQEVATDFAERFSKRTGIETKTDFQQTERLPLLLEQELWRITQEALTNIEKHSSATTCLISFTKTACGISVQISDNGTGFDIDLVDPDHYGILGMAERADAIGATFKVESEPGTGTTITLLVDTD